MELGDLAYDDGIDAIMWVGAPGKTGYHAIGKTLVGEYNPSGRLPDIYAADFLEDPTAMNFSDPQFYKGSAGSAVPVTRYNTELTYGDGKARHAYYVGYEEGIYYGYRWYETAAAENFFADKTAPVGTEDKYYNTDNGVVYPFGYGLSYTTFSQKITGSYNSASETFSFNVEVENTGSRAGKDVVEIYVESPYTKGGIEKSKVTLAAFAKTPELTTEGAGSTYKTTITVKAEDIASYDMSNGGRYVLEEGDYTFYLGNAGGVNYGSHSWAYADDNSKVTLKADEIVYDESNKRDSDKVAAKNLFDDVMAENNLKTKDGSKVMSRAKLAASFPTAPTEADRTMSDKLKAVLDSNRYDSKADVEKHNNDKDEKPVTNQNNGLSLINLRGKNYNDDAWKYFVEQFSVDEMKLLISRAGFQTEAVERLGKPQTNDNDGPQALKYKALGTDAVATYLCALPCEVVLAATWNTELLRRIGQAVGEEGLQYGVNGWYAPGLNIHRSPFGGRNFEYFSEDPVLAGRIAAAEISGAADKGLYCYVKHFVLNDQEAWARQYNSGDWGTTDCVLLTWADEQTMREIYFKAFEIAFKNAETKIKYLDDNGNVHEKVMRAATGVMTSFNFIGNTWTGGCKELLTDLLRGEWGFEGFVLTDYTLHDYMYADQMLRAGGDACLQSNARTIHDTESATAIKCMQAAVKNMCYTVVHSSVMTDIKPGSTISYTLAPWAVGLLIANIIVYLAVIGGVVWIVLRLIDSKKHPDKYKH